MVSTPANPQGICRYCGCTPEDPCPLSTGGGETCAWFDRERTICTGPLCLTRMHQERERWAAQGMAQYKQRQRERNLARLAKRKKKRKAA